MLNSDFQLGFDLAVFGKAAFLDLGKNQFSIDAHFEPASVGGDQIELPDVPFEIDEDILRQTDGSFFISSHGAVFDADIHWVTLLCKFSVIKFNV